LKGILNEKKSSGSWVVGKMDSRDGAQDEMCVKMNKRYENQKKRKRKKKEGEWWTEIVQKETTRVS
jgi:hypothetical protein